MVSIEGGYRNLGQASATTTAALSGSAAGSNITLNPGSNVDVEVDGWFLGIKGHFEVVDKVTVMPMVGAYFWNAEFGLRGSGTIDGTAFTVSASADDDGTDVYYGIGANYLITDQFSAGLQWNRFDIGGTDVDTFDVTATYRF
jgi:OOP family OmpA-OmpF porin